MLHLSSERLAELADGEPTVAEAEHLAACANCAIERSAHQRLLSLASDERGRIAPPLTNWVSLSARLREEEIISDDYPPAHVSATPERAVAPLVAPRPYRRAWLAGLRVAAGLVLAASIEDAANRLSPGARTVFMMHDVEGYTHEEIARELGITAGGSKSQLFKARAKLRRLLAHVVDGLRPDTDPEHAAPVF